MWKKEMMKIKIKIMNILNLSEFFGIKVFTHCTPKSVSESKTVWIFFVRNKYIVFWMHWTVASFRIQIGPIPRKIIESEFPCNVHIYTLSYNYLQSDYIVTKVCTLVRLNYFQRFTKCVQRLENSRA